MIVSVWRSHSVLRKGCVSCLGVLISPPDSVAIRAEYGLIRNCPITSRFGGALETLGNAPYSLRIGQVIGLSPSLQIAARRAFSPRLQPIPGFGEVSLFA